MKTFVSTFALGLSLALSTPVLAQQAAPTAAEADKFVADAEKSLAEFSVFNAQVQWINNTYITDDTDYLNARAGAEGTLLTVKLAKQAAQFNATPDLTFDVRRKLDFLKQGIVLPAPDTPGAADELATLTTRLQSTYGKGKGTFKGVATGGNDLEALMGTTRDPELTKEIWTSWHMVGQPMRGDYVRMVEIANAGARERGR